MEMTAMSIDQDGGLERFDEPMAKHSVWGVGGLADHVIWPRDTRELCAKLAAVPAEQPITWVGLGSNLLVRDGGVRGTVIVTVGGMDAIESIGEHHLRVQAGAPCAKVARFAARQGLTGMEFLAGIPGTMGGALAMNAGCYGGETWDWVESVELVKRSGEVTRHPSSDFEVSYRHVARRTDEWFLSADLRLEAGDSETGKATIKRLLRQRSESQPTGQRSCGSVFKNPPGDYAGRLIESAGLKGTRIGSASVSRKHANFIINDGNASAQNVESLIEFVQRQVHDKTGVWLTPEVQIIGERQ